MNIKNRLRQFYFALLGVGALIWFLVRVIPKPSRATYPCMRIAYPMASSFIIYLLGLSASAFAFGKIRKYWNRARYWTVVSFFLITLIAGFVTFQSDRPPVFANTINIDTANVPIGVPRGIFPGRVIWARNPDATNENCTNDAFGKAYYLPENTNMAVVNDLITSSILSLTGKTSVQKAWDTLFIYFNTRKGKGAIGYQAGEKIFIKTNGVGSTVTSANDHSIPNIIGYTMARTSPQPVLAILRQLINDCNIPQANISVGDPQNDIQDEYWDLWHSEFPEVNYICHKGGQGRVRAVPGTDTSIFYSDHGAILRSGDWGDASIGVPVYGDKIYTVIEQADYIIYVAAMKVHERAGMTLLGKCDFGSQARDKALHLHMGLVNPDGFTPEGNKNSRFGYKKYRILVDLLGHEKLGGNAVLFVVDGLWGGPGANFRPVKFKIAPFNNDWPSSIFMSQDPVALESVCYDILKAEFTVDKHAETYPQMEGVDDHLHQAADSSNWPGDILYDPEKDGSILGSLGVHEHWNNSTDQQYSRNLGIGSGIELIKINEITSVRDEFNNPDIVILETNYPNPFNPYTIIRYHLPQPAWVDLSVYNIEGRFIQKIVNAYQASGTYSILWNSQSGENKLSSGIYFARLHTVGIKNEQIQSQRMLLLK